LIFVLVFASHDFEFYRNVSCEESTVSTHMGLTFQGEPQFSSSACSRIEPLGVSGTGYFTSEMS